MPVFFCDGLVKARAATNRRCIFFDRLGAPAFGQKSKALLQGLVLKKKQSLLQGQVPFAGPWVAHPFCRAWCFFFHWCPETTAAQDLLFGFAPFAFAFPFWPLVSGASSFTVSVESAGASTGEACSSFLVSSEEL